MECFLLIYATLELALKISGEIPKTLQRHLCQRHGQVYCDKCCVNSVIAELVQSVMHGAAMPIVWARHRSRFFSHNLFLLHTQSCLLAGSILFVVLFICLPFAIFCDGQFAASLLAILLYGRIICSRVKPPSFMSPKANWCNAEVYRATPWSNPVDLVKCRK